MALLEYKCPCCSGAIEYNSTVGKMKCPYCDTEFEMDTLKEMDDAISEDTVNDDLSWDTKAGLEWGDGEQSNMVSYECKSCGAKITFDSTTTASSCPFCDNPIVMTAGFVGGLKPDFIIPFKYDKKAAKEAFNKHLQGKKLLPPVFKDQNHIDEIKGVYVPFWFFDSDADANMVFKGTKVRHYSQGKYDCTETSYYRVLRSGSMSFSDIPVDGSEKMDDALMDSLEPFYVNEGVSFQSAYLAGYGADKYDVSAEESIERANKRIKNSTEATFRSTASQYTTLTTEVNNISLHNGKTRYALLPVWILNTTWNNEKYVFAMNGQTGKFVGNLPCDKGLYAKHLFLTWGISAAVLAGGIFLLRLLGIL